MNDKKLESILSLGIGGDFPWGAVIVCICILLVFWAVLVFYGNKSHLPVCKCSHQPGDHKPNHYKGMIPCVACNCNDYKEAK